MRPDPQDAVSDDGTRFQWSGAGPAVALVHGLGLNRHMWQWQLPALSGYRVLSYDLFGHGESAKPPGRPSLSLFADQLLGCLDEAGVVRTAVIGFSLGGMIARRFALDHGDRISALVIMSSAHDRTPAERKAVHERADEALEHGPAAMVDAALARWFGAAFRSRRPDVVELVRGWVTANNAEVYPTIYRLLAEGDIELAGTLDAIRCPTLVMTGAEDHGNSPRMAHAMANAIPGARTVILPALRHMALAEAPDAVNAVLAPFLAEVLAGETQVR